MTRPAYVYRLYDADDVLLYVGCAYDVKVRVELHRYATYFGPRINRVEYVEYPDRATADVAELEAIQTLRPRWNSKGRPPRSEWTSCDYFEEIERISLMLMDGYDNWEQRVHRLVTEFYMKYPNVAAQTLPILRLPFPLRGDIQQVAS